MTREDEDRMAQENYAFGPKGKPVTVEQALARAERAESQLALEYARGVEDERKRHLGGVPFVSREEDYRLGYANAIARAVEDLRAEASKVAILRSMEATTKARTLREAADRIESDAKDRA